MNDNEIVKEIKETSLKVMTDMRDKFNSLAKEAEMKSQNEFLTRLLAVYESTQGKEDIGIDFTELHQLKLAVSSIEKVYLSMGKSRHDIQELAKKEIIERDEIIKNNKISYIDESQKLKEEIEELKASTLKIETEKSLLKEIAEKEAAANGLAQKSLLTAQSYISKLDDDNKKMTEITAIAEKDRKEATEQALISVKQAQEQARKALEDKYTSEKETHALTALNATNAKEIQRLIKEIADIKHANDALISKLEVSNQEKNQAIGEIKNAFKNAESLKLELAVSRNDLQDSLLKNYSLTTDLNHNESQLTQLEVNYQKALDEIKVLKTPKVSKKTT